MISIKKMMALVLSVIMICMLFTGCGCNTAKGQVVAVYDGIQVYESDVQDVINFQLMMQVTSETTETGLMEIMKDAVITYVRMKLVELDLEEKGYSVDEKILKEEYEAAKDRIEENGMSYSEWCDTYRVSKSFLKEELRRYQLANLYTQYLGENVTVTEEEIKEYYTVHAISSFSKPAGYYWTAVLRPVRKIADATELAEAKTEMETYLEKIQNGSMTLEQVDEELNGKYNQLTGYANSIYDGEDVTPVSDLTLFKDEADFQAFLKALDEAFENKDATADEDSEEYDMYMSYIARVFEGNVHFALQNMEVGEIWDKPIESYIGQYIIRLDRVEEKNSFMTLDEVKDEIRDILKTQKQETEYESYLSGLEDEYNVVYYMT